MLFSMLSLAIISSLGIEGSQAAAASNFTKGNETATLFGVHEIVLTGNGSRNNPFETQVTVAFTPPTGSQYSIIVNAFYDGGDTWRARTYVSERGGWTWSSSSPDEGMNNQSGSFQAVDSDLRGMLRKHPANDHQWITEDGKTFLNLTDTAYRLFSEATPWSDFVAYVEDDVALGISALRAGGCGGYAGWGPTSMTGGGLYDRSNWCWDGNNYSRYDLDRFQTTDLRLEWLLNNHPDLYVQLIQFGKKTNVGQSWKNISQSQREAMMDYQIARWGAWPQLYFLIVNDTVYADYADNQDMVREIGAYYAENDPWNHLISAGPKRREPNPFVKSSDFATWHTYLHIEKYSEIDADVVDQYAQYPVHLYYGEDWYEQTTLASTSPVNPDYYYRRTFWSVLLSGGSPNYGGRYPVIHPYNQTASIPFPWEDIVFTGQLSGLDSIRFIAPFFESRGIDLADFQPDDAAARDPNPPGPEGNSGPSRPQAARNGNSEFIVYLPNAIEGERSGGGEFSEQATSRLIAALDRERIPQVEVDLRGAAGEVFDVYWYQVSNGSWTDGLTIAGGDWTRLTSPWKGEDAVLHLKAHVAEPGNPMPAFIMAHRGGNGEVPENTLAAFERALSLGVNPEMDVRLTSDNVIVVIHDATVNRTTDGSGAVADMTLAEIKTLDAGSHFSPAYAGEQVPTLDEVFQLFSTQAPAKAILSIDTKVEQPEMYDTLIDLLKRYNLFDRAYIEVSNSGVAEAIRGRDARVRFAVWAPSNSDIDTALSYAPFERIHTQALRANRADEVHTTGKKLIARVNTEEEWRQVRSYAIDGINTDYPLFMLNLIAQTPTPTPEPSPTPSPTTTPTPGGDNKTLFVVGNQNLDVDDQAVMQRLRELGHSVTLASGAVVSQTDAQGMDLIVISSSVTSSDINSTFRDIRIPLLTWENAIFDDLGMTGPTEGTDRGIAAGQSALAILDSGHPLAAGLTGTATVVGQPASFTWGSPNENAFHVAGQSGQPARVMIFGYQAGATMPGLVAPANRVGFFLEKEAGSNLTNEGWALFDAAVAWLIDGQIFSDVPPEHPYRDEIEILYQNGYTAGCGSDPVVYCPDAAMTRAESSVFVERGIHGVQVFPDQPSARVFDDLPLDSWAAKWAAALWNDGYTAGCGTDPLAYCPWQGHTRAEGAVFYLRMLNGADYAPPNPQGIFSDVPSGWWGEKWVEAAYNAGILPACDTQPLRACPDDALTRGLGAYMMVQAKGLQ